MSLTASRRLLVPKGATAPVRLVRGLGLLDSGILCSAAATVGGNGGRLVADEVLTLLLFLNMKDEMACKMEVKVPTLISSSPSVFAARLRFLRLLPPASSSRAMEDRPSES